MIRALPSRRRALLFAASIALSTRGFAQAPAARGLPLRNLLVELRQGDESSFDASAAGLRSAAVTVGPDGQVSARAGVTLESRSGGSTLGSAQQLRVINGGQGSIRIGASVPMQWLQWVWTPQGPAVIAGSQLVETGRGFVVQPRWPGGDAPVTVEVRSEASQMASGGIPSRYQFDGRPQPEGSVSRADVLTTLQIPLGQWVTIASSGEQAQARERGVASTRESASERRVVVQMRVTAP
ncbi:hypothetical protein [uncultured Methylibium sp.]|uniref:hypothetical protein n=1 Tax=uncultured Methylibium sp. TaxID=381093 RepID=UPI0025E09310|nr:hypothetical protein [uncultured Methylibium sp.]